MTSQPNILLIEDHPILQKTHCASLQAMGCQVTLAANGGEAKSQLVPRVHSTNALYDVVLLDLGLPDINGIELCVWIRRFYSARDLPVFAVTAQGPEKRAECLAAGMQDFFTKPLSWEAWLDIVQRVQLPTSRVDRIKM